MHFSWLPLKMIVLSRIYDMSGNPSFYIQTHPPSIVIDKLYVMMIFPIDILIIIILCQSKQNRARLLIGHVKVLSYELLYRTVNRQARCCDETLYAEETFHKLPNSMNWWDIKGELRAVIIHNYKAIFDINLTEWAVYGSRLTFTYSCGFKWLDLS